MSTNDENATGIGLTEEEKLSIDAVHDRRLTASHYELLGVTSDADRKSVRDAYFALSKRFHPDVFFKRDLGSHKQKLDDIFRAFTRAYEVLSNPRQRAGYDLHLASLRPSSIPPAPPAPPAPPLERSGPAATESSAPPSGVQTSPRSTVSSMSPAPAFAAGSVTNTVPVSATVPSPPSMAPSGMTSMPPSHGSRDNVVVPPRLRTQTSPQSVPPVAYSPPSNAPAADPSLRQRAIEAMARRLGNPGPRRGPSTDSVPAASGGSSASRPPLPDVHTLAEERRARALQFLHTGEEAQKRGDLPAALESFRAAAELNKGDETIRARVEAVSQLVSTQRVNDSIEQAREAMRAGRADNAARLWEQAWQGRQGDPTLLLNAAEVLARHTKDYKRAAELAQRALMIDPRLIKGYLTLAAVFIDAGLRASARGAIENATKLEPNNPAIKELRDKLGPPTIAEQLGLRGR